MFAFSAAVLIANSSMSTPIALLAPSNIEAIDNIPAPFRDHLDAATEINAASKACTDLRDGLELVSNKLAGN